MKERVKKKCRCLAIITVRSAARKVEKSRILITIPRSLDMGNGRPLRQGKKT